MVTPPRRPTVGLLLALLASTPDAAFAQAGVPPPPPAVDAPIPEDPLDPETLALLEALTSTPAEGAPPFAAPVWPIEGPFTRPFSGDRLRDGLARTVSDAIDTLPFPGSALRQAPAPIRRLDRLRVEPGWMELGRLDPWLYGGVDRVLAPDASLTTRTWLGSTRLVGRGPGVEGWQAAGTIEGRSADRSAGAMAEASYRERRLDLWLGVRGDTAEPLRVRSGTVADELGPTRHAAGGSLRIRLTPSEGLESGIGYDFDLDDTRADLHLLQAQVAYAEGAWRVDAAGGWTARVGEGADRHHLQVSLDATWSGDPGRGAALLDGDEGPDYVRARLFVRPPSQPVVRVGGFYGVEPTGSLARAEVYASTSNRWRWLGVEVSGRLSDQRLDGSNGGGEPLVSADARLTADVVGPFGVWARYARSAERIETGGPLEQVDLVEGGPRLAFPDGFIAFCGWYARAEGLSTDPADLWGWRLEGGAQGPRLAVAGAVSRSVARTEAGRLGPEPILRGRIHGRLLLPEVGGFVELGVRAALEQPGGAELPLLPSPVGEPPYAVVDLRSRITLGAGFALRAAVSNLTDTAWSRFGDATPGPGIDVRLALEYR